MSLGIPRQLTSRICSHPLGTSQDVLGYPRTTYKPYMRSSLRDIPGQLRYRTSSIQSLLRDIPGCPGMSQDIIGCPRTGSTWSPLRDIPGCPGISLDTGHAVYSQHLRTSQDVLDKCNHIPGCPRHPRIYQDLYTRMHFGNNMGIPRIGKAWKI